MDTLESLAASLAAGTTTARALVESCLDRIADPAGEGSRAFIRVYADEARAMADGIDSLRRQNRAPGRYAGIPISIKDLLDVAGETTAAGSRVLADAPPATVTAPVVRRVMQAGFIPVGRTNMTEFAFSGLGINPHYGTPSSPWDRASKRIPGGSSSGAGVSVADGMAAVALGTDTGGSCRIPAAMCGITGYKPTARRVPLTGALPLSPSLDSIGPIGRSVACCAAVDALLADEALPDVVPFDIAGLRLAAPGNVVLDGLDPAVAEAYDRALAKLSAAGAKILPQSFPSFDALIALQRNATIAACDAFAWHRGLLAAKGDGYDQRVRTRMLRGETVSAADYIALLAGRAAIIRQGDAETAGFDALVMPTCPLVPPPIASLADEAEYGRVNVLQLRNTTLGNSLDRCAISLPCHRPGEAPVGLMLMGETMGDAKLFRIAAAVERVLAA